jgi:hypothetical protein
MDLRAMCHAEDNFSGIHPQNASGGQHHSCDGVQQSPQADIV